MTNSLSEKTSPNNNIFKKYYNTNVINCIFYFSKQTLELIKNRLFPLLISGNKSQKKDLIRFFKAHNYEITNLPIFPKIFWSMSYKKI